MKIFSGGQANFFGLDIGTTSIRAVQLKGKGTPKSLYRYGFVPVAGTMTLSDSEADQALVAKSISELVQQTGIDTRNVAVNVPSNQVFSSVIELDRMSPEDLSKTIQYQAESFIPTPIAESKIDWAILGDSPSNPKKVEILLSSVPNQYVEKRLQMLEAAGLRVVAFEPDSMALMRSVIPADIETPQMVLDIGRASSDLVIAMKGNPHLIRAIPVGTSAFIKTVAQTLNIAEAQASEFVYKFGLGKDKLDAKVHDALVSNVELLMVEVEKSIKYFNTRYPSSKLEKIFVTGGASSIPELPLFVANRFGINVEVGNSWRNVIYPPQKQNELLAESNHFAVAVGLAERQ